MLTVSGLVDRVSLPIILLVVEIMSMRNGDRVPWADQLRRIHDGVSRNAEWMAPDSVVNQVRSDYQRVLDWQHENLLKSFSHQWRTAPHYMSGIQLKRYRAILHHLRQARKPMVEGVLRADHRIEVRCFSEYGERCLVIDYQAHRRMATYDYETRARLHTQDMGDCAIVCQMVYANDSQHWKIDRYIQQLPSGWGNPEAGRYLKLLPDLLTASGRDY